MKTLYFLFLLSTLLLTHLQTPSQQPQTTPESTDLVVATTLSEKVVELFREQKFTEALPLAKRALEIRERLLPANDLRIEASLAYLGDLQLALRDYDDAKKTYQRTLQMQEQRLGSKAANLAPTLDRLCVVYFRDRNYSEAEETCTRSLAIKELSFGQSHPDVANSLFMLAEQHRARRNTERAASLYLRALSIYGDASRPRTAKFDQVLEGFTCLCHQSQKAELLQQLKSMNDIYPPLSNDPTIRLENEILNGQALVLPKPAYPAEAKLNREEGVILVKVIIDETGKVISAYDVCQGPRSISAASVIAARNAQFSPAKRSGVPIKTQGYIRYRFVVGRP